MEQKLSGKEIYKSKKIQEENIKRCMSKHFIKIILYVLIIVGGLSMFVWYLATRPSISQSEIISRNGLHWHTDLVIYVKGQKQEIPNNIGIGAVHQPIHTHDETGLIHLEFEGLVKKQNIELGNFFKIWDKDMQSFGINMKMMVNGVENTEYGNYIMQNNDKIELRYE